MNIEMSREKILACVMHISYEFVMNDTADFAKKDYTFDDHYRWSLYVIRKNNPKTTKECKQACYKYCTAQIRCIIEKTAVNAGAYIRNKS